MMKRFLVLWMMAVSAQCFAQYMDADNFQEAVGMAAISVRAADGIRQNCTKLLPEKALDIHSLSLHWLDRNRREYIAVKAYSRQASPEWISTVEKMAAAEIAAQEKMPQYAQVQYCRGYFGSIKSRDRDITKMTPRVSKFLVAYLSENPLPEAVRVLNDRAMGCMKQANNRAIESTGKFDLDKTRVVCECLGHVYLSNTTPEERVLEEKYIVEGKSVADLSHFKRVAPLYQQCSPRM